MKKLMSLLLVAAMFLALPFAMADEAEGAHLTMSHCQGEWSWDLYQEIVDKYQELSGNTVELLYVPADSYGEWITIQLAGGTAPDLIHSNSQDVASFYKNNWIVDLAPYYNDVSPWTNDVWMNSFADGALSGVYDPNGSGAMLGIPLGNDDVRMYYNKDIFAELGLDTAKLESWSGVLELCEAIAASGKDYVPFSCMNSISWNLGWMDDFFNRDLWIEEAKTLDIIDANGKMDTIEAALGMKSGILSLEDDRVKAYYSFQKQLSQYFNEGFNAASWEYESLFNEGKAAITINGTWFPSQVVQNDLTLNYGILNLPYVDTAITDKALGSARAFAVGSGHIDVTLTQKCVDDGKLEAGVNFLQYLTDPSTGAPLVAGNMMWMPLVKDVQPAGIMSEIVATIGTDLNNVSYNSLLRFTGEAEAEYNVLRANFLTDANYSVDDFCADIQKLAAEACEEYLADNPELDLTEYLAALAK